MSRPTISVALITFNRCELLARTLPTVLEQDFPQEGYEIVVVDDGSTDGTPELLRQISVRHELRVLRRSHGGVSAARNAAIGAASGEFVLFLDDDLLCDKGLVRTHVIAHTKASDSLLVIGRIGVANGSPTSLVGVWLRRATDVAHDRRTRSMTLRDVFVAANCSAPRDLLLSCRGFDETYVNAREEHELGVRLARAGARPVYEPKAVAHELVTKRIDELLHDAATIGKNEVRLSRAYPEYRCHSPLARLRDGPLWRSIVRKLVTRYRSAELLLLTVPSSIASTLGGSHGRNAGAVLLGARHGAWLRRGAVAAVGSWGALADEFGRRLPVLAYHRVGPHIDGSNPDLTVVPARFERHLRLLCRLGYTTITPQAWLRWCDSADELPHRPVLITFDDAYADLGSYALPALVQSGLLATLFVPSARLNGENVWDEAITAGSYLTTHRLFDAGALRKWNRLGIDIGAHSRTHPHLPAQTSEQLEDEIGGSRRDLERLLSAPIPIFAYPFGEADERVRRYVVATFDAAFTIREGLNTLCTDRFLLHRSVVQPSDSIIDVLFRLRLGWSPLHRLSLRIRRAGARARGRPRQLGPPITGRGA